MFQNYALFECPKAEIVVAYQPWVNFIEAKSWAQSHFTLWAQHLRSFFGLKSSEQPVRAWRRA